MQIFKIIDITSQAKEGFENPKSFFGNLSLAFVEGYAITWFILVVIGLIINFFLGFVIGWWLFQIFFFFGIIILIISIIFYIKIRKIMRSISDRVVDKTTESFKKGKIIEVEVEEVK